MREKDPKPMASIVLDPDPSTIGCAGNLPVGDTPIASRGTNVRRRRY